jgi:hypothetical protein
MAFAAAVIKGQKRLDDCPHLENDIVMTASTDAFEQNYQKYCAQLAEINLDLIKDKLGLVSEGDNFFIPFFNNRYLVSNNGIVDAEGNRPDYMAFVILAKYILLCPEQSHYDAEWVAFKDFKRISHFTNVNYFSSDTERAIEKHFSGRLDDLSNASKKLGGICNKMNISYNLSMRFNALPRISLLLLFNDSDDEFPAKCTVLFQKHAEFYLDPESLAMSGAFLAKSLKNAH